MSSCDSAERVVKDPVAVLDWTWNWNPWLAENETIVDHSIVVPTGLILDSSEENAGYVTAWLSSGTRRAVYIVSNIVTTNQGRTDKRSTVIEVADR